MEIFNNGGILNFNIMASTYKITLTFQNPAHAGTGDEIS